MVHTPHREKEIPPPEKNCDAGLSLERNSEGVFVCSCNFFPQKSRFISGIFEVWLFSLWITGVTQDISNLISIFFTQASSNPVSITCNSQFWVTHGNTLVQVFVIWGCVECYNRGKKYRGAERGKWLCLGISRIDSNWVGLEDFLQLESGEACLILSIWCD